MPDIFAKRVNIKPYEYPQLLDFKDAIRHAYWLHCVSGDDRVWTNEGLLKVKELYEQNKPLTLHDGEKEITSSPMVKTGFRELFQIETKEGYTHTVTKDHRVHTINGWKEAQELVEGDILLLPTNEGSFGNIHDPELAFLYGHFQGDGHHNGNNVGWQVWESKYSIIPFAENCLQKVYDKYNLNNSALPTPTFGKVHTNKGNVLSRKMYSSRVKHIVDFNKNIIPDFIWKGDKETIFAYLKGLFYTDGTVGSGKKSTIIRFSQSNKNFIKEVQLLLLSTGIRSTLTSTKRTTGMLPDSNRNPRLYNLKEGLTLNINNYWDVKKLDDEISLFNYRGKVLKPILHPEKSHPIKNAKFSKLIPIGFDDVYCVSVNSEDKKWVCNGFITHNTEFNTTPDIQDFKINLTEQEREVVKRAMLSISQVEVNVKRFWGNLYSYFPKPEVESVGATFAESEVRHMDAYSTLLEKLGLNAEFEKIYEIPAIIDRTKYLEKIMGKFSTKEDIMLQIILFSLLVEHISLFGQFYIIMSFNKRKNIFKGLSNIVEATSKEEDIHGRFGIEIFNIVTKENPELNNSDFRKRVTTLSKKAFEAEVKILDWIFEQGDLEHLAKSEVLNFVSNRFNKSLSYIGAKDVFSVDLSELEKTSWFDEELTSTKENDFFNKRSIDYSKKQKQITKDDLF